MAEINDFSNLKVNQKLQEINELYEGLENTNEYEEEHKKRLQEIKDPIDRTSVTSKFNPNNTGKKKVEVLIDGLIYNLVSEDNESYLQKIAFYLNKKIDEVKRVETSRNIDARALGILTAMNVTDEFFKYTESNKNNELMIKKLNAQIEIYEQELEEKAYENELLKAEIEKMNIENLKSKQQRNNILMRKES